MDNAVSKMQTISKILSDIKEALLEKYQVIYNKKNITLENIVIHIQSDMALGNMAEIDFIFDNGLDGFDIKTKHVSFAEIQMMLSDDEDEEDENISNLEF